MAFERDATHASIMSRSTGNDIAGSKNWAADPRVSAVCSLLSAICSLLAARCFVPPAPCPVYPNHRTHLNSPLLPARSLRPPTEQTQPLQHPHERAHLRKQRRGELVARVEGRVAPCSCAEGE